MYTFREIKPNSEYRLYSNQTMDKENSYLYYKSYMAYADDLNKSTYEKLLKHKETLDFAIKYVDGQYKAGLKGYSQIVFPQSLNKLYHRTVYQFVRALYRKDKEQKHYLGSQLYWINDKMIKTLGYRTDITKESKYQIFVEFIPSYQSNSEDAPIETISINLVADKKLANNWHNMYQDGFDLVYKDDGLAVRFVTEKIVTKIPFDGKEQYLLITSDGILWESIIDKEQTNDKVVGRREAYIIDNVASKKLRKIKAFKSTKSFNDRINFVKAKVKQLVNDNISSYKAGSVTILNNTDTHSKILTELNNAFVEAVKDKCKSEGLEYKIISVSSDELVKELTKLKRDANSFIKNRGYKKTYRRTLKHRWDEFLLVLMNRVHKRFPRLLDSSKYWDFVKKLTVKALPDSNEQESHTQAKGTSLLDELPKYEFI